jgi:hypothetical protein
VQNTILFVIPHVYIPKILFFACHNFGISRASRLVRGKWTVEGGEERNVHTNLNIQNICTSQHRLPFLEASTPRNANAIYLCPILAGKKYISSLLCFLKNILVEAHLSRSSS